jgi:surface antigen
MYNTVCKLLRPSFKSEIIIIFGVIIFIIVMPIVTLLSITNLSVLNNEVANSDNYTKVSLYAGPRFSGDYYDFGNCTFWVSMRRAQVGKPIPNDWGNAATWATRAEEDGYKVDHDPTVSAIMQTPYVDNGLGHVAFVERVDPNGNWYISEMNVVGFDEVDYKIMSLSEAATYNFIHGQ